LKPSPACKQLQRQMQRQMQRRMQKKRQILRCAQDDNIGRMWRLKPSHSATARAASLYTPAFGRTEGRCAPDLMWRPKRSTYLHARATARATARTASLYTPAFGRTEGRCAPDLMWRPKRSTYLHARATARATARAASLYNPAPSVEGKARCAWLTVYGDGAKDGLENGLDTFSQ
jgi:hypothetical protein